ncbi:MAG: TraR/DksA C4-type zinc finger protein [Desulfobacterales bacterium]|jgi:DnaK suppressor protein
MNTDQKQTLADHIQKTIAELKDDIDAYKALTQPIAPDDAIGRLTRMEAINSKSINEAALRKSRSKLTRLEQTLRDIDDPDFGRCRECDEPIPFARLMIMPESDLCVGCAEKSSV